MRTKPYTRQIKTRIRELGADLAGVADIEPLQALETNPTDLLQGFTRAVSIAVHLPAAVFETISDKPNPLYNATYQTANRMLDELALRTANSLEKDGYSSLPVPASQILDQEKWLAAISHKAVARMAGLGWQGKNLLLITPEYGSRVRLVTVLTEAPLAVDGPVKNRCGTCTQCRDACPARAIKGASTTDHYQDREEALHFSRCAEKLSAEFARMTDIGNYICGVCIKACPFGRSTASR
ncbi:MAG: 4Fe-4S dicluster domain-containing protein [Desulfohalobiaceae bacterium]|nr:4Fe-4S dicluster domain-containing protein [Desulfohalobiaceae bacterium]